MTDRGAHVIDIAQLGAGIDDTGPVEIEAKGVQQSGTACTTPSGITSSTNTYANGVQDDRPSDQGPRGVKFEGDDGWIFVHVHGGKLEAERARRCSKAKLGGRPRSSSAAARAISRNFLDVRARAASSRSPRPRSATARRAICHLNNIAMLLGRKLKWDPKKEQFVGDDEANKLLTPKMREPWTL